MKILLSVAHGSSSQGARNVLCGLYEYPISQVMTKSAAEVLRSGGIECLVYDCMDTFPYKNAKISKVNKEKADLSVEIHLNSFSERANYSSCFYWNGSKNGEESSRFILDSLTKELSKNGWNNSKLVAIPSPGYFLERYWFITETDTPSIIVEPLFLSNKDQAIWLSAKRNQELLGKLVGEGLLKWSQTK
jgi:N-acetylmuramoyl-L-alanine amidase